jgi:dihydrofolate reductase
MTKLRVRAFGLSIDGFGAGVRQDLENPMGRGGMALHEWAFATRTFRRMFGKEGGSSGVDDGFAARGFENIGAWILGRNMFGPVRGAWPDHHWRGWWGEEPPYHCQVFVLTHHARPPLEMAGGTTFHFVTEGIHAALERATGAAGGRDVRLGGGVATIREYLCAGSAMSAKPACPGRMPLTSPSGGASRIATARRGRPLSAAGRTGSAHRRRRSAAVGSSSDPPARPC